MPSNIIIPNLSLSLPSGTVAKPSSLPEGNSNNLLQLEQLVNSLNSQNQEQSFIEKYWPYLLGSLALISSVGGGIWHFRTKQIKTQEPLNRKTNLNNNLQTSIRKALKEYTLTEKINLAKASVQDGNHGSHCQTVAMLNALRILEASGDPRAPNLSLEQARNIIANTQKEISHHWRPDGSTPNGMNMNLAGAIILNQLNIPYGEYSIKKSELYNNGYIGNTTFGFKDLKHVLQNLKEGKVGTWSFSYSNDANNNWNGWNGHARTVYAFEAGSSYQEFINLMNNPIDPNTFSQQIERLLPHIGQIYFYEQDNRGRPIHHSTVSINDLMNFNSNTGFYKESRFRIIDGNPPKKSETIEALQSAHEYNWLHLLLLPKYERQYLSLPTPEEKQQFLNQIIAKIQAQENALA